ncbi:MAG TPA: hypothetical protein VFC23_00365 [Thermoanaerobaculia bacterium]|nr:hypothetical protein [Thermoanaerobaculia bacterium]
MADDEEVVAIELQRAAVTPEAPAIPVYHFVITRVGNEVLLEPGYVDHAELKVAIDRAQLQGEKGPAHCNLYVREKYLCSRDTLIQLRRAADEILSRFPEPSQGGER